MSLVHIVLFEFKPTVELEVVEDVRSRLSTYIRYPAATNPAVIKPAGAKQAGRTS
jgi:hypothetical protein